MESLGHKSGNTIHSDGRVHISPHPLPGTHIHVIVKFGTHRHSQAFVTESTIIADVFMGFSRKKLPLSLL